MFKSKTHRRSCDRSWTTRFQRIRHQFADAAEVRSAPEISKLHEILRAVGVKPRRHPPSTQKLLELALKRGVLPQVNNLVDAYNLVSVRTRCSLGAHDLDRIAVPVELRLFRGDEYFRPLGTGEDKPVNRGEFGYVDGENRVVCRLDSLQAEFSKVTGATSNVLLIVESTTAQTEVRIQQVIDEAIETVLNYCGGNAEVTDLPAKLP